MAGDREISAGGPPFFGGQSTTGFPGSFVDPPTTCATSSTRPPAPDAFNSNIHGYNTAPDNYLLTPQERTSLFAQANYDITDNVRFTTEMLYNERISEQLLAAMPVTGMTSERQQLLQPDQPERLLRRHAAFQTGGARDLIGVTRRFQESGGRSFNQNVKNWHFYGGLEGYFEVGERTFDWDMGYRYDRIGRERPDLRSVQSRQPGPGLRSVASATPTAASVAVPRPARSPAASRSTRSAPTVRSRRKRSTTPPSPRTTPAASPRRATTPTSAATSSTCRPARWPSRPAMSTAPRAASSIRTRSSPPA